MGRRGIWLDGVVPGSFKLSDVVILYLDLLQGEGHISAGGQGKNEVLQLTSFYLVSSTEELFTSASAESSTLLFVVSNRWRVKRGEQKLGTGKSVL